MKHPQLTITLAVITAFLGASIAVYSQSPTQQATDSGQVDMEVIKENVKKRIQEVVKDKTDTETFRERTAYVGTLKSRSGNTFTIETDTTSRLASVSAQTAVIRIPGNTTSTLDDVSLDEYVAAIGVVADGDVLDTNQLIVQKAAPESSLYRPFFGSLVSYDKKSYTLVLQSPTDAKEQSFIISRKAQVRLAQTNDIVKDILRTSTFPDAAYVLAVYLPAQAEGDDNIAYDVLLKPDSQASSAAALDVSPTPAP